MVDISRGTYGRNGIEAIVDNDGILWLNEKHIEEGLYHEKLREVTVKYHSVLHLKNKICKHNTTF